MTGFVASTAGAADATSFSGAATLVDSTAEGCPQFVQKLDPGSILAPHDVQKGLGEAIGAAASASSGTSVMTAGAASSAGTGSASSRLPHDVQKTEAGSACAPQEEQTGRATVTAAECCAAAGVGLPHDVQKLADSST
jgi:hypothetical protein